MDSRVRQISPAEATLYGLAAGLSATLLISALSRVRGLREYAERTSLVDGAREEDLDLTSPMSPATALVQASGPGPEGPAGLFAAKVASGLFGRDLAKRTRPWGRAVHLAYGTFWGLIYGILQTRRARRPVLTGVSHGLFVWAFGPALVVPAMKLMPRPRTAPRMLVTLGVAAHLIYGLTVALVFRLLTRRPAR
ncbi:MAG TPA: DUF6789 family protein [Vicinamibacterales bacterium]|nr:DUF6789 family protein [Vicinamibacterales bacterium]